MRSRAEIEAEIESAKIEPMQALKIELLLDLRELAELANSQLTVLRRFV